MPLNHSFQAAPPAVSSSFVEAYSSGQPMSGSFQAPAQQTPLASSPTYQTTRGAPTAPVYSSQRAPLAATNGHQYSSHPHKEAPQCQEECAEEECLDADQCGAENQAPRPGAGTCGVGFDSRPVLPATLAITTVLGGLCVALLQWPLLAELLGWDDVIKYIVGSTLALLYCVTLGCMMYCALCDPGQIGKEQDEKQLPLPKRTHKTWQFGRPVRRYDHYCRWLTNCIGLLNHREFLAMLVGLVSIAVYGMLVDVFLAYLLIQTDRHLQLVGVVLHFGYSFILLALAGPIFRIHAGLVSRNELASEWKRNEFYVATRCTRGVNVAANELSDDEFNDLFDHFVYDDRRNSFDKGCARNCLSFWCASRWRAKDSGEF